MANEVKVKTSAPGAKQTTKEVHDLRGAFDTLQKQGAKGVGIGIGAGATTKALDLLGGAVSGVTDYIGAAIQAASDMNETESKAKVVFGAAADSVERFGTSAADAFGMSKQAAIEAAASFGNVFTGVGITQKKAADMSETLVRLAGDLASFNNIDPSAALEKLRSGLAGEAEPLRSVGVFLTEAQVKAKAMQMGLADAHGELSEGTKILARYQLILEQTKTAQGDFARTSDGVANTERKLNAEMANREVLIGQKMIPLEVAWQKARLGFAETSGALLDSMDAEHNSAEQNRRDLVSLLNVFGGLGDALVPLPYQLATFSTAQTDAAIAAFRLSEKTDDVAVAMTAAKPAISAFVMDEKLLKTYTDAASHAIDDLTTAVDDGLFGKAINAGHEAQLKDNIKGLIEQRKHVKQGSLAFIELTGQIAENRKALFDLHLQEAAAKGPRAAIAFLKSQTVHAKEAADEIARLIRKYQALQEFQDMFARGTSVTRGGVGGPPPKGKPKASGGAVMAGETYTVGEHGEEQLVMGGQSGTIIPHGASGGSATININVSTPVLTPGGAEALGRIIEPIVTRALQKRGHIAAARAF